MTLHLVRPLALLVLSMACAGAQAQSPPIGFSLQISTEGVFSPKVAKAVVGQVLDGSQARQAGLAVGDELIVVDGVEVPGNGASTLKPHMAFVPGKPKRLTFRRADGSTYEATLTKAAP